MTVVFAAACGGDDGADSKTATSTSTSTSTSASAVAKTAYPLEVTDMLGRKVTIKARPTTVVALSPTAVEMVYAAGGTVVGRESSTAFPEAARAAKDVGSAYQPNFETVLSLKPDLVVADAIIHAQPQLRKPIDDLGVTVIFVGADNVQKVFDGLTLMGKVFDGQALTATVAAGITKARDDAKKAVAGKQVSAVAIIADRDQTLYAAKSNSYVGDIMNQLGLTNPAAVQPDSGPFPGYTTLSPEKMIEYNPDFIFTITPAPAPAPRLSALIPQIPPFKGLKAVTGKHVVEADVVIFLQAPGPRVSEAFKQIAAAITGAPATGSPY